MDIVKLNTLEEKIVLLRNVPVLLDSDVAEHYGVETKEINQAVKNNPIKFPKGYIIELKDKEFQSLRSKFLTTNFSKTRVLPKVFTEQGLYMLATILKGEKAALNHRNHRNVYPTTATFPCYETDDTGTRRRKTKATYEKSRRIDRRHLG